MKRHRHCERVIARSVSDAAIHILLLFLILITTSCSKKQEEVIIFDDSYPLSLAPDVEWALITDPYAAFRSDIDWNADITGHVRRGEILQIYAKSTDKQKNTWYKFEQGWLPQSCLAVYTNRYKAQTAAGGLKD